MFGMYRIIYIICLVPRPGQRSIILQYQNNVNFYWKTSNWKNSVAVSSAFLFYVFCFFVVMFFYAHSVP